MSSTSIPAIKCDLKVYPLRLTPGMEIKSSLEKFVKENQLKSAFILTCCGSVTSATLRYATNKERKEQIETLDSWYEITSLVGTVCDEGTHLHVTLGGGDGTTVSGHVVGGMYVHTTAEIVLGEAEGSVFKRSFDPASGCKELVIIPAL